ncbi:hypothetical protein AMTRI_Chr09g22640 [Amborella trichopoda]
MADTPTHTEPLSLTTPTALINQTKLLDEIAVDYCSDVCTHHTDSNQIHITFDHRGGARWRSKGRFRYGTFSSHIKCPDGNTSGLNFNVYLSSLEGDKSQDEIDFEFLGKDKRIVQTNFYVDGVGGRERIHDLGFDCSDGFHEYKIKWGPDELEWVIDGVVVRREEREKSDGFPQKPMFLYASVWDASYIDEARWTGAYIGCDAPYLCVYRDVKVPMVEEGEEREECGPGS